MLFDNEAIRSYINQVEENLKVEKEKEEKKLNTELHKKIISPRTYSQKSKELEKWVTRERRELKKKQQKMVQSIDEMGQYISNLERDKKYMVEHLGKNKHERRLVDS